MMKPGLCCLLIQLLDWVKKNSKMNWMLYTYCTYNILNRNSHIKFNVTVKHHSLCEIQYLFFPEVATVCPFNISKSWSSQFCKSLNPIQMYSDRSVIIPPEQNWINLSFYHSGYIIIRVKKKKISWRVQADWNQTSFFVTFITVKTTASNLCNLNIL